MKILIDMVTNFLVTINFITLILGGISAAAWLVVRFIGLSEDDISSAVNLLSIVGFPLGILAFLTIGSAFYIQSINPTSFPDSFDILTTACLVILGLVLVLRPIKDFRFGAILSLALGLLGAAFLIFLGAESIKLLSIVFVVIFLGIYGAIRMIEDLYLIIAEILSSPLVSVAIGLLCIVQGLMLFAGVSLLMLPSIFFPTYRLMLFYA